MSESLRGSKSGVVMAVLWMWCGLLDGRSRSHGRATFVDTSPQEAFVIQGYFRLDTEILAWKGFLPIMKGFVRSLIRDAGTNPRESIRLGG